MKSPSSASKPPVRRKSGTVVRAVLFVFCALLFFGGAAAMIYKATLSPRYKSQAKLLVRYVLDRSAVDPFESTVDAGGAGGIDVMDAEVEIIKSADVALEVVAKVGPEKILTKSEIPPTKADAAVRLAKDLGVRTTRGSGVIHLAYHHSDPEVAVAVLKQLIDSYFEKHLEIHRSTGAFESVARQTDLARSRLSQTESELTKLSTESGFLSITDAKTALETQRNTLRASLMDAQVELAEQRVKVASPQAYMGVEPLAPPKADTDLNVEQTRLASLEARLKAITEHAKRVDAEMEKISNVSVEFANLERRRQSEEDKYRYFETSLEKARMDETLHPASMPNIGLVQHPSTPVRSLDGTSKLIATGLAAGGLLLLLRIGLGTRRPGSA